ncbi:hypothetical protein FDJ25_gp189 [Vibrio phage Aphrodite1]|uniref:Uncharacterized protein n=1 Tax=Vibrio phage Aphrodite1 TaxID=2070057 RepID=A0A2I7QI19_9CAUD|nr:hypothetical protein FDJ25_gp189 [Vibrio phage Aphrodite1]AUR81018.1 hypothetical protein Aphrodite1_0010 [Vibrio phage Aphrodite1]
MKIAIAKPRVLLGDYIRIKTTEYEHKPNVTLNADLSNLETGTTRAVTIANYRTNDGYVSYLDTKGLEIGDYSLVVWERGNYGNRDEGRFSISKEAIQDHKLQAQLKTFHRILWKWLESINVYSAPVKLNELNFLPDADKKTLGVSLTNQAGLVNLNEENFDEVFESLCRLLAVHYRTIDEVIPTEDMVDLRCHLVNLGQLKYDLEIDAHRLTSLFPRTLTLYTN